MLCLSASAVVISATKDGVKFSTSGDIGTANITVRQNTTADKVSIGVEEHLTCAAQTSAGGDILLKWSAGLVSGSFWDLMQLPLSCEAAWMSASGSRTWLPAKEVNSKQLQEQTVTIGMGCLT